MKLLVIGAGKMGAASAYDMARSPEVQSVTLADSDLRRVRQAAARANKLSRGKKVRAKQLEASKLTQAARLMRGHDGVLSAVPYFFNAGLARAAIDAGCHFADLGGNNSVVKQELAMESKAARRGLAIAPDCGLSPGMASILAGELMRRVGGRAEALKIYVGGLPEVPRPPFYYHLVFSVEGLINEYVEPAKILRRGKLISIEPLSEPEEFRINGFAPMVAFHTSGGTSTLPETFKGRVGECFEKTLRYPSHYAMIRSLYQLGMFSSEKLQIGKLKIAPRELTAKVFEERFAAEAPDVVLLRVEAHNKGSVASFSLVDHYDLRTRMSAMMRTTALPASIVLQMIVSGAIPKRGVVRHETDVPAALFLQAMAERGIRIQYDFRSGVPSKPALGFWGREREA